MRFVYDDLSDIFTNVHNGIVVGGIWDSSVGYVTCTNQVGMYIVGVGIFVYIRGRCYMFGPKCFIMKLTRDRGGTCLAY